MNPSEASEVARWRILDRHVQGLTNNRPLRAQTVVDIAEDAKAVARQRKSDAADDLLQLHQALTNAAAKRLVADAITYLRAEYHLTAQHQTRSAPAQRDPAHA